MPHSMSDEHMPDGVTRTLPARAKGLRRRAALTMLALLCTLAGCSIPTRFHSATRQQYGLVIILPGIEGQSFLNRNNDARR